MMKSREFVDVGTMRRESVDLGSVKSREAAGFGIQYPCILLFYARKKKEQVLRG